MGLRCQNLAKLVKGKETKATILPNLTPEESELFAYIKEHNIRLEQERITHKYVLDKLLDLLFMSDYKSERS